jgi:hypothetical protein
MSPRPLTGLFLGAGASFDAGMRFVWDSTDQLKSLLKPDEANRHIRRTG